MYVKRQDAYLSKLLLLEERQRAGGSYAEGAIGWGFKPQPIESTV
jgi:hypothetical protein